MKLTRELVLEYKTTGENAMNRAWAVTDEAKAIYKKTFDVFKNRRISAKSRLRLLRSGIVKYAVDQAAARIITDYPQVKHEPEADTKKARAVSDTMELVSQADMDGWASAAVSPPFRDAALMGILGKWCLKGPMIHPRYLDDEPEKKKGEKTKAFELRLSIWRSRRRHLRPFTLYSIDPHRRVIHPPTVTPQPEWVIELSRMTAAEARARLNVVLGEKGKAQFKPTDIVELVECVTADERLLLVNGQEVPWKNENGETVFGPQPNIYRQVYYLVGYSPRGASIGDGSIGGTGGDWGTWEENRVNSMLNDASDSVIADSIIMTGLIQDVQKHVFPKLLVQKMTAAQAEMALEKEIVPVDSVENMKMLETAQIPNFVLPTKQMIMDDLQRATSADILRGIQGGGVTSGRQAEVLISAAAEDLAKMVTDMERAAAQCAEDALLYRKHIFPLLGEESCTMQGKNANGGAAGTMTLQFKDIPDTLTLKVTLLAKDKTEEERKKAMGMELYKAGLEDPVRVHEDYLGNQDGFDRMVKVDAWKAVRENPEIQALISRKAIEKVSILEQQKQADEFGNELMDMMQGGEGLPGEPGVADETEIPPVETEQVPDVMGLPNPQATLPNVPPAGGF